MEPLKLVPPDSQYADSYRDLVHEFVAAGEKLVPFTLAFDHADFPAFLARLSDCSRGIGIPEGFVPHSTLWLVTPRGEVVGVSNIRHTLTPRLQKDGGSIGYGVRPSQRRKGYGTLLLTHSLAWAKAIGLRRVLITCAKGNIPSARVIRQNAGVLASEAFLPDRGEIVQRYWIAND